jgi:hypothetical protein
VNKQKKEPAPGKKNGYYLQKQQKVMAVGLSSKL